MPLPLLASLPVLGGMSLERVKRARKGLGDGYGGVL